MTKRSSWSSIVFAVGLTLVALALWTPRSVGAAVRDVQAGESIQAAIDVALPGDTIRVAQGVFSESLVITKSLTLEGGYTDFGTGARIPRTSVIIPPTGRGLYIYGPDLQVTVDGFEVTQATNRAVQIDVDNDSAVTLNDNFIHDNGGTGIYAEAEYRSALHITHNDVMTNVLPSTSNSDYGGIYAYVYLSGTLTLTDNDIIGNRSFYDYGGGYLEIESFGRFTIEDNQILSNSTHVDGSTSWPYRDYGGLYFGAYSNSHGTFDRNRINGNYADDDYGGGEIELERNSSSTFYDNEFRGNRANYRNLGGLLLYVSSNSHLVGDGLVIADNEAGAHNGGGYIGVETSSSVQLPHTQIRRNRAGDSRGGIDVNAGYNSSIDLSGAQVTDNRTGGDYGGLLLNSYNGGTIDAHDLYIYNNVAQRNYGGLTLIAGGGGEDKSTSSTTAKGTVISVTHAEVVSNSARSGSGGGVYVEVGDQGVIELSGSRILFNSAGGNGGGLYADYNSGGGELYFENNHVISNRAEYGAGCYLESWDDGATFHFNRNRIEDNVALEDGGGCYMDDLNEANFEILENEFERNTAGRDYGGLYLGNIEDATLNVWDNAVIDNRAGISGTQVLGGNYGGVVFDDIYSSQVDVRRNRILSNTTYHTGTVGGDYAGVFAQVYGTSLLRMTDNRIAGNEAGRDYAGLYVELINDSRAVLEENVAQANEAFRNGAGIYIYGRGEGHYFLLRNRIVGNRAGSHSSGLVVEGSTLPTLRQQTLAPPVAGDYPWGVSVNNLIVDNGDVGVYLSSAGFGSTNDTIADNGDFGLVMTDTLRSTAHLSNTLVWGHSASFTRTQLPGYTGLFTMVATYSDIQGGWPGMGNIDADPLFAGAGDYHLQSGSPAVDVVPAGMAPATDIEGTSRPYPAGGLADIGAFELGEQKIYLPLVLRSGS